MSALAVSYYGKHFANYQCSRQITIQMPTNQYGFHQIRGPQDVVGQSHAAIEIKRTR
jgi:hypothetical protein